MAKEDKIEVEGKVVEVLKVEITLLNYLINIL
jgi:translation initiation factor IF-1